MHGALARHDRQTQLSIAVEILTSLIRNISLKRALHEICPSPHLSFWRVMYGNLMDMAVLDWCKLFGSDDDDRQPAHWKNVVADQHLFRNTLLDHVQMTASQWLGYWQEMKLYRDTCVAHHDPKRAGIPNFLTLQPALLSAFYYFDYSRSELLKVGINQQPTDIRQYAKEFEVQGAKVGRLALAATASLSDTDYECRGAS